MKGIIGAIVGGLLGAGIWAAIIYFMNAQSGLVAWAVGGLVGLCSMALGGRGLQNGIICAVIAALAILAGKGMGLKFAEAKLLAGSEQAETYDRIAAMEGAFEEKVQSPDDYKEFIARQGLFNTQNTQQVTREHLEKFETDYVPILEGQSFNQWMGLNNESAIDGATKSFELIDIVFLLLGVATAYKVGRGSALADI